MQAMTARAANATLAAAGLILGYAVIIAFTDNYVRVIAAEGGLWQFHATRTAMALAIAGLVAVPLGLRLRPVNPRAVLARSVIHACAMVVYFGCLAFLPVAVVAAGLFTAPIFVLLIARYVYARPIGPVRILAVAVGFLGVILVLGPARDTGGVAAAAPVVAGALYALGNVATREWCPQESAETLTLGFFLMLGVFGLLGMAGLALWAPAVPDGAAGFVLRGFVWPSGTLLFWTFVQALGSLVGVAMMVRAYQIADASRVAIFEYVILPASAFWSWALWGETLDRQAWLGIGLIVAAGAMIVIRADGGRG